MRRETAEERTVPSNIEAEDMVLGSLLIDNECFPTLNIEPIDFFRSSNGEIFTAMLAIYKRGGKVDQITVGEELRANGKLSDCGGTATLSHIISQVPTSLHCGYYADIVKRLSICRQLINAAGEIARIGYSSPADVDGALGQADDLVVQLRKTHSRPDIIDPKTRANYLMERYVALSEQTNSVAVSTGIADLDYALGGGLYPGELCVLGARTGLGKSTFARNVANRACESGPVLFASAEMTIDGHSDRDVAEITGLDINIVRRGNYSEQQLKMIVQAVGSIYERNVFLYPDAKHMRNGVTVAGITTAAEQVQIRYGNIRLIVVDYLQRLRGSTKDKRYQELGDMTAELADLAKSMNCPLLLLSQIGRDSDERRPMLSDLYESGRIEMDADVIMLLYRLSYYFDSYRYMNEYDQHPEWKEHYNKHEYPRHISEVILAKRRQASVGSQQIVPVYFDNKNGYRCLERNEHNL